MCHSVQMTVRKTITECHYAGLIVSYCHFVRHYGVALLLNVIKQNAKIMSVIMLCVLMLSAIMLSVMVLCVVILSAIMLIVDMVCPCC